VAVRGLSPVTNPTTNVCKNEVGGDSNTPLPDSKISGIVSLPPVADTIHVSFTAYITKTYIDIEKESKRTHKTWVDRGAFDTKKGSLKGFTGYDYIHKGKGEWSGIIVLIGPHEPINNIAKDKRNGEDYQMPSQEDHDKSLRSVRVLIGSTLCWKNKCNGIDSHDMVMGILNLLHGKILATLPITKKIKIRRYDSCMDHWGYDWEIEDLQDFACRQKGRGYNIGQAKEEAHGDLWVFRATGGWTGYVGSRGASSRFLRIYDKIAEAKKTGKLPWLEPIWRANGWDGKSKIWRAEIEHGGDWLKSHGVESLADLKGFERESWSHYLKTCRHAVRTKERMDRRPTSPVWAALNRAVDQQPKGVWKWTPRPPSEDSDMERLLKQAGGCMLGVLEKLETVLYGEQSQDNLLWDVASSSDDRKAEVLNLLWRTMTKQAAKRTGITTCTTI